MRVLVTGGRAPATLDLVRLLHDGGVEVHLAESLPSTVTSFSKRVAQTHAVPPPRQRPEEFLDALADIVADEEIDLILPTCEEVFWVALRPELPAFVESRERLRRVHHKGTFAAWCEAMDLPVPRTIVVTDRTELHRAMGDVGGRNNAVLKPCFSRFATRTVIRPTPEAAARVHPTPDEPWVVQRYLPGPVVCTWGAAHNGRLTVHTAYRARFTAGQGSAVHFRALRNPAVWEWVATFAEKTGWTGQLAFDFVVTPGGPVVLECNPRLTSGVHLLKDGPELVAALTDPDAPLVEPTPGTQAQIAAAMLLYGMPRALAAGDFGGWLSAFVGSREVSWRGGDLHPFWSQWRSILALRKRAKKVGEGLLDASTWDIRWDGEEG